MHPALCSDALHAFECVNKEDKGKLAAERQDGKGRADCYEALKPTHLGPRRFTVSRPTSRPSTSRTAATHCPSTDGDPCPRPHLRPHSLPSAPPERTLPDDTQRIAAVRVWTRRMRPSWWYIVISYSRCTLVRSSSHPLLLDPVDLLARRSQPARSLSCSTHSAPRPLARVLYVPSAHRLHCPDATQHGRTACSRSWALVCSARSSGDPGSGIVPSGPRGRFRLGLISAPTLVSSTPLTAAYSSSQTPRRSVPRTPNCRLPADRTRRLVEDKEWLEGRYEVGRGLKRTTRTCTMDGNSLSKPVRRGLKVDLFLAVSSLRGVSPSPGDGYPPRSCCECAMPADPFSGTAGRLLDGLGQYALVLVDDHSHNPPDTQGSFPQARLVRYVGPSVEVHQAAQWQGRTDGWLLAPSRVWTTTTLCRQGGRG